METPNPVTIKCMFAHVPLLEIHRKRAPNSGTLPTPNQNRSNHIGAWGGWVVSGSPSPPVPGGGWAGSPHPATGSPRHRSRRIRQPQELGAAVHVPNRVEREQRGFFTTSEPPLGIQSYRRHLDPGTHPSPTVPQRVRLDPGWARKQNHQHPPRGHDGHDVKGLQNHRFGGLLEGPGSDVFLETF